MCLNIRCDRNFRGSGTKQTGPTLNYTERTELFSRSGSRQPPQFSTDMTDPDASHVLCTLSVLSLRWLLTSRSSTTRSTYVPVLGHVACGHRAMKNEQSTKDGVRSHGAQDSRKASPSMNQHQHHGYHLDLAMLMNPLLLLVIVPVASYYWAFGCDYSELVFV